MSPSFLPSMGVDLVRILAQHSWDVTVTSRTERKSEFRNIRYIQGNAHDCGFLKMLLKDKYDAIVDFMVYQTDEFKLRRDLFLDATGQYLFLSSSRVYADSVRPITEDSPRLLDVIDEEAYLRTDEYALAKARQENLLRKSGRTNWTIIRPYITYSNQRLQLGVYEKELWLYRALHGRTVLFPKSIAEKYTTMTLGEDVAQGISGLIGNERALGQAFHITTDQAIQWNNVLAIYQRVFRDVMDRDIKIQYTDDAKPIYEVMGNKYQVIYDRYFNRRFDNAKFLQTVGNYEFTEPEAGMENCLREFLKRPEFGAAPYSFSAQMDKLTKERTGLSEISGFKQKGKYLIERYFPNKFVSCLKMVLKRK